MLTTVKDIDIQIDKKQVCRYIGYSDDVEPSPRIASLLDQYIDNAHHLIEPKYSCVIKNIEQVDGSRVFMEDSIIFDGQVISNLAAQCQELAVFVLTIGPRLEEMASQLAEDGLIVESYILDAIGSVATEYLAGFLQGMVREFAQLKRLSISRRFSPGYCDWHINQQEMVFNAMDGDLSGVLLTDNLLMSPQKSVSGIIGIGAANNKVEKYNPCIACTRHDCVGRR
ncbi:MAG: vitamin B12 dependent-methionine synthase activation domain-containing protein [Chloroflexota bacterium]|nr:vitamin B12 dependent-methionine synthase activation domain-containing protein [Chloroflexota bacterium]